MAESLFVQKWLIILQYCQDSQIEVVWDFMNFLDFKVNFDMLENCHIVSWILFISSNYWKVVEPIKRTFHPIIGSSRIPINEHMIQLLDLYYIILDYAAPDIHVPISILLIQILDIIFHSNQKSHYTSSSFWMPGRIFTTVYFCKFIAVLRLKAQLCEWNLPNKVYWNLLGEID